MIIRNVLTESLISLSLPGETKQEVIEAILDVAVRAGKIPDREAALACLLERERRMSTGMQYGIAIPHGKTDSIRELVACIAIKREGVEFNAIDKQPSTIFVMTLSPINQTGPHLQFLGEVSKLLRHESCRNAMLQAQSPLDILTLFRGKK